MGRLLDKSDCSGCMACLSVCPIKCITMKQDENGFYMPCVDEGKCIQCGLCEKTCKKANVKGGNVPLFGKAFVNSDPGVMEKSSSGGAFAAIADMVLSKGGVVYGAAYDEVFHVRHIRVDSKENLCLLSGSKYVQSDVHGCLEQLKCDLKAGIMVLFSGTPCQVAGVVASTPEKQRENLLAVDFICHGVPAPNAWEAYLQQQESTVGAVQMVNMRDHRLSHENFGMCITGNNGSYFEGCGKDPYLRAFLNNLILRESCYRCKHKKIACKSDITLADLWGERMLLPADRFQGRHSLVIANSSLGATYLERLADYGMLDTIALEKALMINKSRFYPAIKSTKKPTEQVTQLLKNGMFAEKFAQLQRPESFLRRLYRKLTVWGMCFAWKHSSHS